jgi:hypothetical protein
VIVCCRVRGRLIRCLGFLALGALATGCGSSDSGESAAALWCEGVCAAVVRCGLQGANCEANCVRQEPSLAAQTASGAAAQKPCLAQLSCTAIGGDDTAWKTETDACWKQAIMTVAVTARARQFCPKHAMTWFDCGYTLSVDDCEHDYSMWNDAIINQVALCDDKQSCDEFQACEKSVFASL